ncbi:MAG TPA: substrate-binding domain-containing protein [Chloroflexota bacterium]
MTDVLVYAPLARADAVRGTLARACRATGVPVRLELFHSSGSLFQRLRARRAPPPPDVILWSGPYAAHAAALDNLLQPYQPPMVPPNAAHEAGWRWLAVEFDTLSIAGEPNMASVEELASAPRLAVTDPERSEHGMFALLATLDRARQKEGAVESGWTWWSRRRAAGIELAANTSEAISWLAQLRVTHVFGLAAGTTPLTGLAPVPHAVALPVGGQHPDQARQLVDWLASPDASGAGGLSVWQADANGLRAVLDASPPLDVDWGTRQYVSVRRRWAS